ncbi:hypothetical protein HanRHA438_Chr17g0810471 [Helianthus annuus]|nr:hypothetical protein HanRHA438_Chr17g0810471 [Helianthus annuus]
MFCSGSDSSGVNLLKFLEMRLEFDLLNGLESGTDDSEMRVFRLRTGKSRGFSTVVVSSDSLATTTIGSPR